MAYSPPSVTDLGTLANLTLSNKIGTNADAFTGLTNGAIVGDIVPTVS